jgi:hypothetical protein
MAAEEEIVELKPDDVDEVIETKAKAIDRWDDEDFEDDAQPVRRWVRVFLVGLTVPWIIVFIVALQIYPYEGGEAMKMGSHQQLGLPECNFKSLTSIPCPSCGMTTSFSLLMRADVWNSLQANFAGTILATFGLLFVPWAFASAFFGRFVLIRSLEIVIFRLALVFLILLFGRWGLVILLEVWTWF